MFFVKDNNLLRVFMSLLLQPVGCDGELYSSKTVDRCGVCGGNGTSCQRISGSYRKALTQLGNTHTNTHVDRCACKYNLCTIKSFIIKSYQLLNLISLIQLYYICWIYVLY